MTRIRCKLGFHDHVYDYSRIGSEKPIAYCKYCGETNRRISGKAELFLLSRTNEKFEEYKSGKIPEWELNHFIKHMWDRGHDHINEEDAKP